MEWGYCSFLLHLHTRMIIVLNTQARPLSFSNWSMQGKVLQTCYYKHTFLMSLYSYYFITQHNPHFNRIQ